MIYKVIKKGTSERDIPKSRKTPAGWSVVGYVVVHSTDRPGKHRRGQRVDATKTPVTLQKAQAIHNAIQTSKGKQAIRKYIRKNKRR